MATVQITLPDQLAQEAQRAGLFTPIAMERLLADAIRQQQAASRLLEIADDVVAAGIAPMSIEEINAQVKAARQERRQRASGH